MTDYYHFFGLKDKQNRFLMRLVNPFGFDITTAVIKLSQLFATHGSCPATNDVTWSPWKAGKTLYQFWNVNPNKLGLIKSATPTLTLDGVDYLGLPIYLLSLANYTKIYASNPAFAPQWKDLGLGTLTGLLTDFVPVNLGAFDPTNMAGIYINTNFDVVAWATIKAWVEAGNIWIEVRSTNITPITQVGVSFAIGDSVTCIVNEPELSPIYNKPAALTTTGSLNTVSAVTPPSGWTWRPLFKATVGGVDYNTIVELIHSASGGRVIYIGQIKNSTSIYVPLNPWWWPIIVFQYPLMKKAGVSAYYTE